MYQLLVIVGNLGKDPEMRYTPAGEPVTSFSIAVNKTRKLADGSTKKVTTWFRVTAWGKVGENANAYLHKGDPVLVEGEISPDEKTGGPKIYTRQDGTAGANFEVTAHNIRFLPRGTENGNGHATEPAEQEPNPLDPDSANAAGLWG